jgi:hypothetical protein
MGYQITKSPLLLARVGVMDAEGRATHGAVAEENKSTVYIPLIPTFSLKGEGQILMHESRVDGKTEFSSTPTSPL